MHAAPFAIESPALNCPTIECDDLASETFLAAAREFSRQWPTLLHDAVANFQANSHQSGALLIKNMPVGTLPLTPATPTSHGAKDQTSERTLLAVASLLGEPVGYRPEMGGRIVQNLVPVQGNEDKQISTSSKVPLLFHTETAFHPYRPAYLVLLCLKGDDNAYTTLASIREVLPLLDEQTVNVLFEPRFRTAVDASFLNGRKNELGEARPVLSGDRATPTLVFDEDLMVGTDEEAQRALHALADAIKAKHARIALQQGDVLIVDNSVAVHGRSEYTPRFDGNDRWLQRTFVVAKLPEKADDLEGRVITTTFGN